LAPAVIVWEWGWTKTMLQMVAPIQPFTLGFGQWNQLVKPCIIMYST